MTFSTFLRRRQRCVTCVLLTIWITFILGYVQLGFDQPVQRKKHSEPVSAVSAEEFRYISQLENEDPTETDFVDNSIARALKKKVRILCLILTTERFFGTRVKVLNATWVRRCNDYYFIVNSNKTSLPNTIVINKPDTRENLIYKVHNAFMYTYNNLIDTFDWILKADDDTYMVMENLRFLLDSYDPDEPSYMGFHFNMYLKDYGYMSGGAGYVISNKGLRHLVERGFKVPGACAFSNSYVFSEVSEDFEMGKCLQIAGVKIMNTLDRRNRESFHPYPLFQHLLGNLPEYLFGWANNRQETGIECCSQFTISFHYSNPSSMLLMDHLLYRTSVFGRRWDDTITGNDVFQIGPVTNMNPPEVDLEENKEEKDIEIKGKRRKGKFGPKRVDVK